MVGIFQVRVRPRPPVPSAPRAAPITQMPGSNFGPIQRLTAHVEMDQLEGNDIRQTRQYARPQVIGKPMGAQPFAFQHEESQFLGRVDPVRILGRIATPAAAPAQSRMTGG